MERKKEEMEIDLLELFRALWRKALLIILVAVIAASAVFAYTLFFVEPSYDAKASIFVNNSSFSFGATSFSITSSELSASNSLVSTYIYILNSRTTLEDVIAKGNLNYTYEDLSKMITSSPVTGTAAFDVIVRTANPIESEKIANLICQVLPERIAEIVDGSSVRIVDYAIVPAHRAAPSYTKNTIIGFLAGALIAAAFVIVRYLIDERNDVVIHSSDELKELFPDIKVLALIPDMRLSEKRGYYYSSYYGNSKEAKQ